MASHARTPKLMLTMQPVLKNYELKQRPRLMCDAVPALGSMAKSTNHTAHNQSYKNHRNGIKKPGRLGKGQRRSCKGVRPPCSNT